MRAPRDPLLRLFALHGGFGAAVGAALALVLVAWDVHGLATVMGQSIGRSAGAAAFSAGFALIVGAAAIATALMLLGRGPHGGRGPHDGRDPRGGGTPGIAPVPVPVRARRRP
jgi:hypothetical protein